MQFSMDVLPSPPCKPGAGLGIHVYLELYMAVQCSVPASFPASQVQKLHRNAQ